MTGIVERRFWAEGTVPSDKSIASAEKALAGAAVDRADIGVLVHGSVCRDHLEPATACRVHHRLGLSSECMIYDVSNACLGLLNGMIQVANMIELGQVKAGLVVGTESGRHLVEHTIEMLNASTHLTRQQIKTAVASLTIGSASCAVLLTDRSHSRNRNRLHGAAVRTDSAHHTLCQSGEDQAVGKTVRPLMQTDSERLMREGVRTGAATFPNLLRSVGWSRADLDRTVCHQVGLTHRKQMLDALEIDPLIDFATVQWLGNTGSVALPITLAIGIDRGVIRSGDQVGLLGIGSGINCLMLGVDWQRSSVSPAGTDGRIDRTHQRIDRVARRAAEVPGTD